MFTDEQQELWDEFGGHDEDGGEATAVLGFQWICSLEGIPVPDEEAIRAALSG